MSGDAENEAYFSARYAEARVIFPLLGYAMYTHNAASAITTEELNVAGIAVFNLPPGTDVPATDVANHTCKHEAGHAYLRRLERATGVPRTVYVEQFRVKFGYPTDYAVTNYSPGYVSIGEAWAEAFCNASEGRLVTSKSHLDELVDPLVARAWFQGLDPAHVPVSPPTSPTPPKAVEWLGPVPQTNYFVGRSGNAITLIVDHWMATTFDGALAHFMVNGIQVSAHYLISQKGRIVQVVRDEDTAYHAGSWPVNQMSIGIEHEGGPNLPPFPDALYAASAWLHHKLSLDYGIRLVVGETVKPHRAIVPTQCPGTLDLDRIVREAGGAQEVTDQEFIDMYNRLIKPGTDATTQAIKDRLAIDAHHRHENPVQTTSEPK